MLRSAIVPVDEPFDLVDRAGYIRRSLRFDGAGRDQIASITR